MSSWKINVKFQGIIIKIEKNVIFSRGDKFESRAEKDTADLRGIYIRGAKEGSTRDDSFRL